MGCNKIKLTKTYAIRRMMNLIKHKKQMRAVVLYLRHKQISMFNPLNGLKLRKLIDQLMIKKQVKTIFLRKIILTNFLHWLTVFLNLLSDQFKRVIILSSKSCLMNNFLIQRLEISRLQTPTPNNINKSLSSIATQVMLIIKSCFLTHTIHQKVMV